MNPEISHPSQFNILFSIPAPADAGGTTPVLFTSAKMALVEDEKKYKGYAQELAGAECVVVKYNQRLNFSFEGVLTDYVGGKISAESAKGAVEDAVKSFIASDSAPIKVANPPLVKVLFDAVEVTYGNEDAASFSATCTVYPEILAGNA